MASSRQSSSPLSFSADENLTVDMLSLAEQVAPSPARKVSPSLSLNAELKRLLSSGTVVSTSSSNATLQTNRQFSKGDEFVKIGAGSCGVIFSHTGTGNVLKLAKHSDTEELWSEYGMHKAIHEAVQARKLTEVNVPTCFGFVPKTYTKFWNNYPTLAEAARPAVDLPCHVIIAERIQPLPQPIRSCLIDKFCAEKIREKAYSDEANKDCLIRPYLGSTSGRMSNLFFSLRNFKLHLNQMEEIGLDVESIARSMGAVLAILHWEVKSDARDVEFAIGSSAVAVADPNLKSDARGQPMPADIVGPESAQLRDFQHRTTCLWLLDFNQVKTIKLDEEGVEQAVQAFKINDPYFPRPLQTSPVAARLWDAFAESYTDISNDILGEDASLSTLFLNGVVEVQREKMAREAN